MDQGVGMPVRIKRVALYLGLTFALSWGSDWLLARCDAYEGYRSLGLTPWGMLAPAAVALALELGSKDSPTYAKRYRARPRWILYSYLALTAAYGLLTLLSAQFWGASQVVRGTGQVLITLWTLGVLYVGGQSDKADLERAGLQLGDVSKGQRFVLGAAGFLLLQAGLNLLTGQGPLAGRLERIYGLPIPGGVYPFAAPVLFVAVALIGGPLSGLAATFGEEYGWRGYLQRELKGIGKRQSALVVGLIWGLWHVPVILRGIHTYPPTWVGVLLGLVFFTLWGIVQSYAVLKTRSIWTAAFMHGVVNSVYSFALTYIVRPRDPVLSFGLGVYGLAMLAAIVALVMRDRVWQSQPLENAPLQRTGQ